MKLLTVKWNIWSVKEKIAFITFPGKLCSDCQLDGITDAGLY